MANIKVRDLIGIAGADLFNDSESFIQDLSDYELALQGGVSPTFYFAVAATYAGATAAICYYYS